MLYTIYSEEKTVSRHFEKLKDAVEWAYETFDGKYTMRVNYN